jgi:hypothetical protein
MVPGDVIRAYVERAYLTRFSVDGTDVTQEDVLSAVATLEGGLRQARADLLECRDEMEVSTQEAFVDAAIARVDEAVGRIGGSVR